MVTFTYDPIVGITSKADENNIITYYHYDAAGRLSFVKDSKGNTIKKIDYKYANQ
jgi:YD repeat-containing protein